MDGTQDVSGTEQQSVCLRFVDKDLNIHESFVGLYEPRCTTGEELAAVVEDVLIRFNLPMSNLRGQTYDGAANMAGPYSGCQAVIASKQPLAVFVHCGSHSSNLVMQHTVACNPQLRDAIQWVQDLGTLYRRSLKYKKLFAEVAVSQESTYQNIKPLCPTRWLCRTPAIRCVVLQYKSVLRSLEKFAQAGNADSAAKSAGLLDRFEKGSTLIMLMIALQVFTPLENLNRVLQAESATLGGMFEAAKTTVVELQSMRNIEAFRQLFRECSQTVQKLDLEEMTPPRQRNPPARYAGRASPYHAATVEEHFRAIYFVVIDNAIEQLQSRFDKSARGARRYLALEQLLLSRGKTDDDIVSCYPELKKDAIYVQLAMFHNQYSHHSVDQVRSNLQGMCHEVRALFGQVEQLVRLLLVCPASSCTAERSFSALRRLKTWLRNNMTQTRLNSMAVCHVHQELLDNINLCEVAEEFTGRSDIRRNMFGSFRSSS